MLAVLSVKVDTSPPSGVHSLEDTGSFFYPLSVTPSVLMGPLAPGP